MAGYTSFRKATFVLTTGGLLSAYSNFAPRTRRLEQNSNLAYRLLNDSVGGQGPATFVSEWLDPNNEEMRREVSSKIHQAAMDVIGKDTENSSRYYSSYYGVDGHFYSHVQPIQKKNAEEWASSPLALIDHFHCIPGFAGFLPPDHHLLPRFLDPNLSDSDRENLIKEFKDELRGHSEILALRGETNAEFIPDGTYAVIGHSLVTLEGHKSYVNSDGYVVTTVTAKTTNIHGSDGVANHAYYARGDQAWAEFIGSGKANGIIGDVVNVQFAKHIWEVVPDMNQHYRDWVATGGPESLVEFIWKKDPKLGSHFLAVFQIMNTTQATGIYVRNLLSPYDYGERKGTAPPENSTFTPHSFEEISSRRLPDANRVSGKRPLDLIFGQKGDFSDINVRFMYETQPGELKNAGGLEGLVYVNDMVLQAIEASMVPQNSIDRHNLPFVMPELADTVRKVVDASVKDRFRGQEMMEQRQKILDVIEHPVNVAVSNNPSADVAALMDATQQDLVYQDTTIRWIADVEEGTMTQISDTIADSPQAQDAIGSGKTSLLEMMNYARAYFAQRYVQPYAASGGLAQSVVKFYVEDVLRSLETPEKKVERQRQLEQIDIKLKESTVAYQRMIDEKTSKEAQSNKKFEQELAELRERSEKLRLDREKLVEWDKAMDLPKEVRHQQSDAANRKLVEDFFSRGKHH